MALELDLQPLRTDISSLECAILETLAYSDIFDYPLKLNELHKFLTSSATLEELASCLSESDLVESKDDFYFLKGRADILPLRLYRENISRKSYARAIRYGQILGHLPFIRMVALTGSLALRNCDETADYDFMLVAKTGRVWLARAFALLLNRIAHLFDETLCPNLIVSESALEWTARNLYIAREMCQMIPLSGEGVYNALRIANRWVNEFLPNNMESNSLLLDRQEQAPALQSLLEFPLRGSLGDLLESWEMTRKIARFTNQAGYGPETTFNADICQGNFDHHGSWAMQKYHERLRTLGIESPLPAGAHGVLRKGLG
ncbi:MAG: hypothetical protein AB1649_04030 [Chloroflexota bacterium]